MAWHLTISRVAMHMLLQVCLLALWMPVAHGHAALVASDPVDGALLTTLPARIALTFNEPVSPLVITLVSPDGTASALGGSASLNNALHIELPSMEQRGTYGLSWRVVSADGHPIGGTLLFAVGERGATNVAPRESATVRSVAIWFARFALYVGLFFGVGAAVFRAFVSNGGVIGPPWARRAAAIGLVAIPACWVLHGLDALDAPWGGVFDARVWRAALGTSYAFTLALASLALLGAAVSLRATRLVRSSAAVALLLLGAALASSGHASAAPPQWLARPAVLLHGVALAFWLGALAPLIAAVRSNDGVAPLRAFSRRIPYAVLVLVMTGVILVALQVDRPAALWATAYGRVLLLKLSLVLALFALAAWNRYRLTGRVLHGDAAAPPALARIIRIEIVVALCVLAVVALWRFTPPPRALIAPPSVSAAHFHAPGAAARLSYTPVSGEHAGFLRLELTDAQGAPLQAQEVTVSFSNTKQRVQPVRRAARPVRPGSWEIAPLDFPNAPRWDVEVDVLITDFDRIRLEGELVVLRADPRY